MAFNHLKKTGCKYGCKTAPQSKKEGSSPMAARKRDSRGRFVSNEDGTGKAGRSRSTKKKPQMKEPKSK